MSTRIFWLLCVVGVAGCIRDPLACQADSECFRGEYCSSESQCRAGSGDLQTSGSSTLLTEDWAPSSQPAWRVAVSGSAHLVWQSQTDGSLTYARQEGDAWTSYRLPPALGATQGEPRLAVSDDGVHVFLCAIRRVEDTLAPTLWTWSQGWREVALMAPQTWASSSSCDVEVHEGRVHAVFRHADGLASTSLDFTAQDTALVEVPGTTRTSGDPRLTSGAGALWLAFPDTGTRRLLVTPDLGVAATQTSVSLMSASRQAWRLRGSKDAVALFALEDEVLRRFDLMAGGGVTARSERAFDADDWRAVDAALDASGHTRLLTLNLFTLRLSHEVDARWVQDNLEAGGNPLLHQHVQLRAQGTGLQVLIGSDGDGAGSLRAILSTQETP